MDDIDKLYALLAEVRHADKTHGLRMHPINKIVELANGKPHLVRELTMLVLDACRETGWTDFSDWAEEK